MATASPQFPGQPPQTKPVAAAHKFNEQNLANWLRKYVAGYSLAEAAGGLQVLQFSHGQSNPTFCLTVGSGDKLKRYVLRKKPNGQLLPSAHAIEREYRVLSALRGSRVPVPRTYALCEDSSIIGTPFYIMQYVTGRIFKEIDLPGMKPADRFAIYAAMNRTLAMIHAVDINAVGLGDYGKSANYIERNVKRWSDQYNKSSTGTIKEFDQLVEYLKKEVPRDPHSQQVSLIHGDYRLDNLIFHPKENRVIAVLDWELSTVGTPTTDLAYNCMPYYLDSSMTNYAGLKGLDLTTMGIPEIVSYKKLYINNSYAWRPVGQFTHWNYYVALSMFRYAAILQGVYKRSIQGNASSEKAGLYGEAAKYMAALGLQSARNEVDLTSNSKSRDAEDLSVRASLGIFHFSDKFWETRKRILDFMDEYIYPNEAVAHFQHEQLIKEHGTRWIPIPIIEELKQKAKEAGLWNFFMNKSKKYPTGPLAGYGLTNLEYAPLCEIMGRSPHLAPEVFNCSAPDTGNMEVLRVYGSKEQQEQWLKPLMNGEIRSCFGMTEPLVASSDATNIESSIERVEDGYIINARKWWTSGAGDPRCKVCILMGKTNPEAAKHKAQSMLVVDMTLPGVRIVRPMHVFGSDDAPHGHPEVEFVNVKVPHSAVLLGEGRGFEISQGRLGPGRIHHCMRLIGMASRALELMIQRIHQREPHGSPLYQKGTILADLANMRIEIEQTRLLTLQAAAMMDQVGNKLAYQQIAMIKVAAPNMALRVIDKAIQAFGAEGISQDTILPTLWTSARTLRLADGPDEVHRESIAKVDLKRVARL